MHGGVARYSCETCTLSTDTGCTCKCIGLSHFHILSLKLVCFKKEKRKQQFPTINILNQFLHSQDNSLQYVTSVPGMLSNIPIF